MMAECPNCGQRLRAEWTRCPRCRQLLPEKPVETLAAPPATRPTWVWVVVAAAVCGFVAIAIALVSSDPAPDLAQATAPPTAAPGLKTLRPGPTSTSTPREVDPQLRATFDAHSAMQSGSAAYAQGDLAGALAKYEAAVAANPDDPDARNNLAQVLIRLNRVPEALPHLDEAVRIDPQQWKLRFNRARLYGQLNRGPEAVVEYQSAAQLFPEDYATQYNLGMTLMRLKRYQESASALERAVALAPGEPSFLISLGTAFVGAEQPDRAKAAFEKFLELAPADPEVPRVKALLSALAAAGPG